jgi:nucleoside-diphosphate-sugar epimerase
MARVLVVGGTGPTGIPLVQGLVDRGHHVTILHRGTHERDETPAVVEHLHADPYDPDALAATLGATARTSHAGTWDVVVAMYGRLRAIAAVTAGRCGQFVSVGGVPAYRGWMNPFLHDPLGLPVPVREDAPTVADPADDEKGYRIVRTEQAVLEHHPGAVHFRYPYVYGPHQLAPREWCVVRRILDGRTRIVVADGGLTLHHHGFTENLAHALLLAIDHPDRGAGKIYNAADEEVLTVRQVIELIAVALADHRAGSLEIVSLPYSLAAPAWPMLAQPSVTHRVLDISALQHDLGYHDLVPAREAVGRTARWLAAHPPERGGQEEMVLTDPFDYAAEDELIDRWQRATATIEPVEFATPPRFGLAYSGPGGRPRSQSEFIA